MAIRESYTREEVAYVAAKDLIEAKEHAEVNYNRFPSSQSAYNNVGYFDEQEYNFEVYEVVVQTTITKVEPPYNK